VLEDELSARIKIPSVEQIREYQEVIGSDFLALNGTLCVADGLKLPIQKFGGESTPNAFYNGWQHSH
jgi:hypothetical protein